MWVVQPEAEPGRAAGRGAEGSRLASRAPVVPPRDTAFRVPWAALDLIIDLSTQSNIMHTGIIIYL